MSKDKTPLTDSEKAALSQMGKFFLLFFGTKLALYLILRAIVKSLPDE